MLSSVRSPLGAPGVFALPEVRVPALHPQRMDVCAFVGVAPRGPARAPVVDDLWPSGYRMVTDPGRPLRRSWPVAVRSFDEYVQHFGAFEGPGLLPRAVASFFEQGGRIAWIVRIVHDRIGAFSDRCAQGAAVRTRQPRPSLSPSGTSPRWTSAAHGTPTDRDSRPSAG